MNSQSLTIAAITTFSLLSLMPVAKATLTTNGTQLNGLTSNGVHMNGISANGTQMEQLSVKDQVRRAVEMSTQTGLTCNRSNLI